MFPVAPSVPPDNQTVVVVLVFEVEPTVKLLSTVKTEVEIVSVPKRLTQFIV
jgi:hypothetical protein